MSSKIVSTISYSQEEILNNIIKLYAPDPEHIECDVTYSIGNFYKNIPEPKYKFDLYPQVEGVIKASADNLPLADNVVKSLMFDPPFIASWNVNSEAYVMSQRFSSIKGINNLLEMYQRSITEAARVLKRKGILIVKCQDTVYGGKQYFMHTEVQKFAEDAGFIGKDLFILLAKVRKVNPGRQIHARKYHSYFWVFKKR